MKKVLIVLLLNIFCQLSYGAGGFTFRINNENTDFTVDACTQKMTISCSVDVAQNMRYYFTLYKDDVKIINKEDMNVSFVEGWNNGYYSCYQASIEHDIARNGGTYKAIITTYAGFEVGISNNKINVTVVPYTAPKLTFNINDNTGAIVTICEGSAINLNGSLSTCEEKYKVSVIQSDINGNTLGSEISNQYDGNVPNIFSIANMCTQKNFKLENSKYYKITLSILQSGEWKSLSKIIYMLPDVLNLASSDLPVRTYAASNQIVLSAGFGMKANGFKAYITSCTKSYLEDSDDLSFEISRNNDLPKIDQPLIMAPSITIFPQPSTGLVYIKTSDHTDIESLEVFDYKGQSVFPMIYPNDNNYRLDLSRLSNGCFYLKVRTQTDTFSKTIIIKK